MENQEIKLLKEKATILSAILDNNDIEYSEKNDGDKNIIFIINKSYIEPVFDIITDLIAKKGIDEPSGDINNFGKDLDDIAGMFAKIIYL
jgi:hypothetical protein